MNIENYTIAAFISAGMHRNVAELDEAKEILGTGCFEFVSTAVEYTDYIQQLYATGLAVVGSVPGVFDYEVSEEFGTRYVSDTIFHDALPDVDWACDTLYKLARDFWSKANPDLGEKLSDALSLVKQPKQPEL